jgi:hypothetical protein
MNHTPIPTPTPIRVINNLHGLALYDGAQDDDSIDFSQAPDLNTVFLFIAVMFNTEQVCVVQSLQRLYSPSTPLHSTNESTV